MLREFYFIFILYYNGSLLMNLNEVLLMYFGLFPCLTSFYTLKWFCQHRIIKYEPQNELLKLVHLVCNLKGV